MNIRISALVLAAILTTSLTASSAEARTKPDAHRSTSLTTPSVNAKLSPPFTNSAGDITVAAPLNWGVSQSESWSKDSEGVESYSEDVEVTPSSSNTSYISISAESAENVTKADLQSELDGYLYEQENLVSEGTTTVGADPAIYLESKDSYGHDRYVLMLKNGWKYTIHAYSQTRDWKRSSSALNAAVATVRINKVQ